MLVFALQAIQSNDKHLSKMLINKGYQHGCLTAAQACWILSLRQRIVLIDCIKLHHTAPAQMATPIFSCCALQTQIGGSTVKMGGIAKGSGMIHPNMATMLSVITSDAAVSPEVWRGIMRRGAENSFNQVGVDYICNSIVSSSKVYD